MGDAGEDGEDFSMDDDNSNDDDDDDGGFDEEDVEFSDDGKLKHVDLDNIHTYSQPCVISHFH